jgi:hypothetical protein
MITVFLTVLDQSLGPQTTNTSIIQEVSGFTGCTHDSCRRGHSLITVINSGTNTDIIVIRVLGQNHVSGTRGTVVRVLPSTTPSHDFSFTFEFTSKGEVGVTFLATLFGRVTMASMEFHGWSNTDVIG